MLPAFQVSSGILAFVAGNWKGVEMAGEREAYLAGTVITKDDYKENTKTKKSWKSKCIQNNPNNLNSHNY